MSRKLSKLICLHTSEWGVEYSSLELEVTAFFDKHIEDANKKVKEQLKESLEALKPKSLSSYTVVFQPSEYSLICLIIVPKSPAGAISDIISGYSTR